MTALFKPRLAFWLVFCLLSLGGLAVLPGQAVAAQSGQGSGQGAGIAGAMSSASQMTGPVMILPFQINASPEMSSLQFEFPEVLAQRLAARGVQVITMEAVVGLLRSQRVTTLDLATVRRLVKAAGAQAAIYGALNQVGDTYSVDSRLVEAGADKLVKPIFVEQQGKFNLPSAVEDLAARIASEVLKVETIAQVEVRGTKVLDPDVVLMRINTKKGDPVDPVAIDREVKRIWDLGYFNDVKADVERRPDGLALVYTVQEKPRIESIAIEGSSAVKEADIIGAMSNKAGSILNDKLLAQDLQKISELYRKEGYYLAKVDYRVDTRQGGASAALILNVDEGSKLYIKKVILEGVKQVSEGDLRDDMAVTERGLFSFLTGKGVLKEELLERDSSAITAYYMNHGFMDVRVAAPKVDYQDDGIVVTFSVDEGERYRLGTVRCVGELIDTDEVLLAVTETDDLAKKSGYFNLKEIQGDVTRLTDYYSKYGYAFANVNPRPKKHEDGQHIVDIDFVIEKQEKVYVRRVVLEGNHRTRDNVVLREMRLYDGDRFDGDKLRRSMERLNRIGYFELAESELVPTQREDEVDLKITLKEKSTGSIVGGVGYSTYSDFGVTGTITENNLWGRGYSASIQALLTGMSTKYTASFTNPRYNDTNLAFGVDLYNWDDDYYDYSKKTTGGVLRFGYPLGEYTSIGWGYRLDFYKLYDFDEYYTSELIRQYEGNRVTSALMFRISRDTTDTRNPTTGNIDRVGVEYAGNILGGDDKFITAYAEHHTYYKLLQNHIAHFRIKGSAVFNNGGDSVPVFERFWMGGIDSVRGYRSKDIVPRDPATGERIGGTRMAFANFEYIWSISPDLGLNLVPFFDIGVNIPTDQDYNFSDSIKKSFGAELRWRSPMGDLRFSYGWPLDKSWDGEKLKGRFEFSMGQFF